VSAAAGYFLGVLDWFWAYKLAGHVHCIGWRPLRTALLFVSLASMPSYMCTPHGPPICCFRLPLLLLPLWLCITSDHRENFAQSTAKNTACCLLRSVTVCCGCSGCSSCGGYIMACPLLGVQICLLAHAAESEAMPLQRKSLPARCNITQIPKAAWIHCWCMGLWDTLCWQQC